MPKKELHDITVNFHHETDKAIAVSEDGETIKWLPKSLVEYEKATDGRANPKANGTLEVTAPEWILSKNDFAGF
jgi:hypothetical protein